MSAELWPELSYAGWKDTRDTLHLWTQIVGKIRLVQTPWTNHSWHVTLATTSRGMTTGAMPWEEGSFQIDFDFLEHQVLIETSRGGVRTVPLMPRSVADFHGELFSKLAELGPTPRIYGRPNEVEIAIPFAQDREHASYDAAAVSRFFGAISQADRLLKVFRARFIGKCSPVHFFWGGFDLAVTRFSGRRAPPHPGGVPHLPDAVAREAYSHQVSSAGFWPGAGVGYPAFYSYAYPEPPGFREAAVRPEGAAFNAQLGEFVLPYEVVRTASDPEAALMAFLTSTYDAAADAGGWDRRALECSTGQPGVPRPV